MLRYCQLTLKKHSPVWITTLLLILFSFNTILSDSKEEGIFYVPDDLEGDVYTPPDDTKSIGKKPTNKTEEQVQSHFKLRTIYLPYDLSDWEQFDFHEERKIESVRIFILGKRKDRIDIIIKNPVTCKKFQLVLHSSYMFRPAVSDIGRSFGATGVGAMHGVLQVRFKGIEKPIIIGIAKMGFWLGRSYGTHRQTFYSKGLAVVLDQALKKHTEYKMPKNIVEDQSGSHFFNLPKEITAP